MVCVKTAQKLSSLSFLAECLFKRFKSVSEPFNIFFNKRNVLNAFDRRFDFLFHKTLHVCELCLHETLQSFAAGLYQISEDSQRKGALLLSLLFKYNQRKSLARDVSLVLIIYYLHLFAALDEIGDILQRYIRAVGGVIEFSILISFDNFNFSNKLLHRAAVRFLFVVSFEDKLIFANADNNSDN